jgi:hypothetical protein
VAGDSTEPESYKEILDGVTDVVHTVGMLMENDYKKIVQANNLGEAINGVGSVLGQLVGMKDNGNPFKQNAASRVTYEMMNRDTGKSLKSASSFVLLLTNSKQPFHWQRLRLILPPFNPTYTSPLLTYSHALTLGILRRNARLSATSFLGPNFGQLFFAQVSIYLMLRTIRNDSFADRNQH